MSYSISTTYLLVVTVSLASFFLVSFSLMFVTFPFDCTLVLTFDLHEFEWSASDNSAIFLINKLQFLLFFIIM